MCSASFIAIWNDFRYTKIIVYINSTISIDDLHNVGNFDVMPLHACNPPLLHQNLMFAHIIYSTTTTNKNIFKYPNSIYIKSISEFLEHNTSTNREICKILSDNTHDFSLGTEINPSFYATFTGKCGWVQKWWCSVPSSGPSLGRGTDTFTVFLSTHVPLRVKCRLGDLDKTTPR